MPFSSFPLKWQSEKCKILNLVSDILVVVFCVLFTVYGFTSRKAILKSPSSKDRAHKALVRAIMVMAFFILVCIKFYLDTLRFDHSVFPGFRELVAATRIVDRLVQLFAGILLGVGLAFEWNCWMVTFRAKKVAGLEMEDQWYGPKKLEDIA